VQTGTAALGAALLTAATGARAADSKPALTLAACERPGVGAARCGTYQVYEDRARRTGRRIGLNVVVLPATGVDRAREALTFFAGGPSEAATQEAAWFAREVAALRDRRDILLVDQRGTGGSHPLDCTLYGRPDDLQSFLGDFFPPESVRRCRAELAKDADLRLYTTAIAVDDLDDVRAALGYERLDVMGGSYGTRAALVYLRRHGEHVRTATLFGVDPTGFPMPLWFARDAQRALDGVVGECAADRDCRAAFPDLQAEVRSLFAAVADRPVRTEVVHPTTGAVVTVSLSRDLAAEAVRYLMYHSGSASLVPAIVHAAAQGDFGPLAEFALFGRREIVSGGSTGLYLSVTCAEDLPRIAPGEGERAARGSFLGDYRLRQQREACRLWARGEVPADFAAPVVSDVPVLLVTGEWDPVTPPSQAADAARHLSRSLAVVVPHGGHSFDGLEGLDCVTRLVGAFVDKGGVDGLDTSCLARVRRPGFAKTLPPLRPAAVPASAVAALAGTYRAETDPVEMTVEAVDGRLKASLAGSPPRLLVPVSTSRFRAVGALGTYLVFETAAGRVQRVVLEEGGVPVLVLTRSSEKARP
jgi:pimeloyl-ACP methyl ester carboxylesterase